jgi:O-antigen ligase
MQRGIVFVRRLARGTRIFFASLLLIDLLVVGNFFGIEKLAERIQQAALDGEMRTDLSRDTLAIVGDYPLTGTGAGSFYSVFPMYNTGELNFGFAKHAHNDYLEFATDLGLLRWSCWLLACCGLYGRVSAPSLSDGIA